MWQPAEGVEAEPQRREVAELGITRVMVRWSAALGVEAIQRAVRWTETA